MNAMIFAAGLGTRLKPLTDSRPKALVEVGGVVMLERVAGRLIAAGADHLVINAHHFASQIEDFVAARDGFGVRTDISLETELLETGGGVLNAERFLSGGGPFVIHNVDVLSNLDIRRFAGSLKDGDMCTLAVSKRKSSRQLLFDRDMRLVGRVDLRDGRVDSPYGEIDPSRFDTYAFAGIHLASDRIFELMRTMGFCGRFPIFDFYLRAAADHAIRGYVQEGFRMMDMGKAEVLEEAAAFAAELEDGRFCECAKK